MRKIAIGITGASGSIYASLILEKLNKLKDSIEVSLVFTKNAFTVWEYELENKDFENLPFKIFENTDFNAPFASGSSSYDTFIIIPCSMGTLSRIAHGISDSLLTRAADVMLKERKKLICVVREAPYNLIHIQNMEKLTLSGGIICPATPSFYSRPKSMDEACMTVVDRVLKLADIPNDAFKWNEK